MRGIIWPPAVHPTARDVSGRNPQGVPDGPARLLARGSKPLLLPFPDLRRVQWLSQEGSPLTVAGAAADSGSRVGSSPTAFRISPLSRASPVEEDRTSFLARQPAHNKRKHGRKGVARAAVEKPPAPPGGLPARRTARSWSARPCDALLWKSFVTKGLARVGCVCYTPRIDAADTIRCPVGDPR